MKRAIRIVVLACALTIGAGGTAVAHDLTVTTPDGEVVVQKPLAKGITPRIFDSEGNYVGEGGTNSAASQGTNTACEAVPDQSAVYITGGTCHR